ncbi:MAG: hypothetical protein NVS4B12_11740 [Ktedonobacteraceae bacterium]
MQGWDDEEKDRILPTPPVLNDILRTRLQTEFASTPSFSIMLMHVSQLEPIHITPETAILHARRRYHPSVSVVEQVMVNIRRAIRTEDLVYLDTGKGAAIIFPCVDQQGAYTILERVNNSVNLLQAETIIPPLTRETDIVLGVGSYPEQGPSLEQVLAHAGRVFHRLTLRPAITPHLWDTMPAGESPLALHKTFGHSTQNDLDMQDIMLSMSSASQSAPSSIGGVFDAAVVPFLRLPAVLPTRLKNLVPYTIAEEFRCVPVGRDHNRLTLAMIDPTDAEAISAVQRITGMSIFPVSCDKDALDVLLAVRW